MDNSETQHRKLERRATQTPLKQTPLLAVRETQITIKKDNLETHAITM
jgi:threonine dehydratase